MTTSDNLSSKAIVEMKLEWYALIGAAGLLCTMPSRGLHMVRYRCAAGARSSQEIRRTGAHAAVIRIQRGSQCQRECG